MDPLDTMVVLSLVKPAGDRWPLEAAIVTRLAQLRGGGWCSGPIAAEWTGADEVACRRALLSLDRRKVIRRDAGESGRDHIRWCAVNDDWRRWRVDWLLDPSQIAAQLAYAAQQRNESPLTRIFARSYSARSVARIARSYDARSWEEDMALVAGIARQGSARSQDPDEAHRAVLIARSLGRRRASLERAILANGSQEGFSTGADANPSPSEGAPTPRSQEVDHTLRRLRARILSMAVPAPNYGRVFLNGPPLVQLAELVDEHGEELVARSLDQIPAGQSSPVQIIDHLKDLVLLQATGPMDVPAPIDPSARVSHLQRIIATYEREGAEAPRDLVDELTRWQTGHDTPQEVSV